MTDRIPIRIKDGFWVFMEKDPVKDFSKNDDGTGETSDVAWVTRAEKAGVVERLDKLSLASWDEIKMDITIVEGYCKTDPVTYKIEIEIAGQTRILELGENELLRYKKFQDKFAAQFQKVLPYLKDKVWGPVIDPFLARANRIRDETNEVPIVLDVINLIEESDKVVDSKEDLVGGTGFQVWLDRATDTLFVWNKRLEPTKEKYDITWKRLHDLLEPYLKDKAKRERLGKGLAQLWQFRPEKFEIMRREGVTSAGSPSPSDTKGNEIPTPPNPTDQTAPISLWKSDTPQSKIRLVDREQILGRFKEEWGKPERPYDKAVQEQWAGLLDAEVEKAGGYPDHAESLKGVLKAFKKWRWL